MMDSSGYTLPAIEEKKPDHLEVGDQHNDSDAAEDV